MVQQLLNHFSFNDEKKQLKKLLSDKVRVSFILNQPLGIYLDVNVISGQSLARTHQAEGVITFDEESGVEKWFYDGYGERINEEEADSKVVHKTEQFRERFQDWFSEIKSERHTEIHNLLTHIVPEEKAKQIEHPNNFTDKTVYDVNSVTTPVERHQLKLLGLEVEVQEWIT